ncbi:DsbA family protein, partial [Mammaliicoccus sciuri]
DLHISREMDINMTPSLVFFNEDVHSEGLKVEGLYPYHIYTYIIQELIGTEVEKQLPPKLLDYIQSQSIISEQEIATIYEWPEKIVKRELKKLQLQNYIEQQDSVHGDFWKFKKSK